MAAAKEGSAHMPRLAGRAGRELTPIQLAILDFIVALPRHSVRPVAQG
jgi:hypothetical protein